MNAAIRVLNRFSILGLALSMVPAGGCFSSAPAATATPQSSWLSESGFSSRGTWPSAILHLSRAEIGSSGRLSDLLRNQDGIRIRPSPPEGWGVEQARTDDDRFCQVHVYLNGNRLERARSGLPISFDGVVPTSRLDGLEYHLAPDGPTFEADGCGSLLLWSEDRRTLHDQAFHGSIEGRVLSSSPDSVIKVELEPVGTGRVPDPDGSFAFSGLIPGEYELIFITPSGPVTRQRVRVYAFRESHYDLEIRSDSALKESKQLSG